MNPYVPITKLQQSSTFCHSCFSHTSIHSPSLFNYIILQFSQGNCTWKVVIFIVNVNYRIIILTNGYTCITHTPIGHRTPPSLQKIFLCPFSLINSSKNKSRCIFSVTNLLGFLAASDSTDSTFFLKFAS